MTVQVQHGFPQLWALVDPTQPPVERTILTRGTGHDCPLDIDEMDYLGTYQVDNGHLIFHVFITK